MTADVLPDAYTVAWLIWLFQFVAIEGFALFRKTPGATLSEHVREWASIENKGRGWQLRRFGLLAFLAWLAAHLLTPAGTF
jgi:hypothetical protein